MAAGLGLLIAGGESLVRGAASLARTIGMSSLMVGLIVVSFATSAPELAVSTGAVVAGYPGLAVGNVVGSNIANVLLVLGVSALCVPLLVRSQIVRTDIPVMVALSVGVLLLALDGTVGPGDGVLLFAALLAYVAVSVVVAHRRRNTVAAREDDGAARGAGSRVRRVLADALFVAVGAALLVVGARLLVTAAGDIAAALGVSDLVIGLTVVAVGTSLPELVTCVVAVVRGERDIAVGNIVGSNVFNIGFVLGVTAIVAPQGVSVEPSAIRFDLPIMIAVALVLLPVAFTGSVVTRWEGALLVAFYAAYLTYLVLATTEHEAFKSFAAAMLWFAVPITALWLLVMATHELRVRRRRRRDGPPALDPADPGG
nr:calcium/sodium antiporter [Nocardiopsis mwathae]